MLIARRSVDRFAVRVRFARAATRVGGSVLVLVQAVLVQAVLVQAVWVVVPVVPVALERPALAPSARVALGAGQHRCD